MNSTTDARNVLSVDLATDDLTFERQGLRHDVETAVVLVREGETDIERVLVLAFSPMIV